MAIKMPEYLDKNATKIDKSKPSDVDVGRLGSIDDFFQTATFLNSRDKAVGNTLFGIDHAKTGTMTIPNKESYGYTFFTRPQLNLGTMNLRNQRHYYNLLTNKPNSIHAYARHMLDPRLYYNKQEPIRTPLVDPLMPFIPLLTNTLDTMSGWPDMILPTHTSKPNLKGGTQTIADGQSMIYETFDIDCTFKTIRDDPTHLLISTWLRYMSDVFLGKLGPYLDMIAEGEIDYNTRIYRLTMDEHNKFVKKISSTGASIPVNEPTGRSFDFNINNKYNDQIKQLNIRFRSDGACYTDSVTAMEFNATVAIFNPYIRDIMTKGSSSAIVKIPFNILSLLNFRGYPFINLNTMELEWYISKNSTTYARLLETLKYK